MLRLAVIFALMIFTANTFAQAKIGIMGTLFYSVPEVDLDTNGSIDEESDVGYGVGMRALVPLTNGLYFRTGAGFIEKNFGYEFETPTGIGDADVSIVYLNVPATLYLGGLDNKFGVFAGPTLNAKMSDECEADGAVNACSDAKVKTLALPVVLGFDFAFTEKVSMELSYEYGIIDVIKDVRLSSAALSMIYNFD